MTDAATTTMSETMNVVAVHHSLWISALRHGQFPPLLVQPSASPSCVTAIVTPFVAPAV
jgi:hypothetical protein